MIFFSHFEYHDIKQIIIMTHRNLPLLMKKK